MNDFSYINTALQAISSYKTRDGLIATYALRINSEEQIKTVLNAIAVAHDRTVEADTNHRFNDGEAPICHPIAYLDFVQTVMNRVCGLARRDLKGKRTEDFGNGIDFTQDLTDQLGFNVDTKHIAELVDEDFRVLNALHCYIAQGMPYLTDIDALRYHAESVKLEDDTWIKDNIADSFDEAISIFDKKAEEYAAELAVTRQGESASVDFTGDLKDTADVKRTKSRRKQADDQNGIIAEARKALAKKPASKKALKQLEEKWATATA